MKKTVLFVGDSITDCDSYNPVKHTRTHMGYGYPMMAMAKIDFEEPEKYTFLNRGISGNRIVDIYARMKKDILNLKPDYISILVGVNDVWHELDDQNGVSAEKYERIYKMLVEEILQELPDVKMAIFEPYVLPGSCTVSTEEQPDRWENFSSEVAARGQAARRVAEAFNLPFVPIQEKFSALNDAYPGHWTTDGVHPTRSGHEFLKRQWLSWFETVK